MTISAKRICAVRQFPFDTHLKREVDALLDAGHEVDVVCMASPGQPRHERRDRLTIWRMPVEHRREGAVRYVVEHATFVASALLMVALLHSRRRFELIQINTPPDSVVLAALVPKLTGTPVLLDLVECTPEFFSTRFETSMDHPLVRTLATVEQLAIRFTDHAITGTRQMKERFVSRGADARKIDVVLNASDEKHFAPPAHSSAEPDGAEGFTLICHGSIERRYGLDNIIQAVAALKEEIPELRFEVYGDGSDLAFLQRLTEELGVGDRVAFRGFVPIEELVRAIARADVGVVAVKRDPFRDLTHTNKMFDFIAMGRPAIVSWTRSVADYFDDTALEFFQSDDPSSLAQAIRRLRSDPERREAMVAQASKLYQAYRWPKQRQVYLGAVEALSQRRGRRR